MSMTNSANFNSSTRKCLTCRKIYWEIIHVSNECLLAIYLLQVIPLILELLPEKERTDALLTEGNRDQTALHHVALNRAGVSIHGEAC